MVRVSRARQSQLSCALWGTHQSNTLMGPSGALCCALWARSVALAVLGYVRGSFAASSRLLRNGGAYRDRTDDLMLAKQPLSQLS
jgi:hypothetical protein